MEQDDRALLLQLFVGASFVGAFFLVPDVAARSCLAVGPLCLSICLSLLLLLATSLSFSYLLFSTSTCPSPLSSMGARLVLYLHCGLLDLFFSLVMLGEEPEGRASGGGGGRNNHSLWFVCVPLLLLHLRGLRCCMAATVGVAFQALLLRLHRHSCDAASSSIPNASLLGAFASSPFSWLCMHASSSSQR